MSTHLASARDNSSVVHDAAYPPSYCQSSFKKDVGWQQGVLFPYLSLAVVSPSFSSFSLFFL